MKVEGLYTQLQKLVVVDEQSTKQKAGHLSELADVEVALVS